MNQDLLIEFATRTNAGELFDFIGALPDPDPILAKMGKGAEVLDALSADDQVCTAMQARKLRVLNQQDYDFTPGLRKGCGKKESSPQAQKLCSQLTDDLENINLRNVFSSILDAPFHGYSVLELIWKYEGGRVRLADIVEKPRKWFTFNDQNKLVFSGANDIEGQPLPAGKFILVQHFPKYENPYGLRLLSRCFWPVAFKRGGIQFLAKFIEKYGMPWTVANAPMKATRKERFEQAQDLASMVQDAVAVIPHGSKLEIVENKGNSGEVYENYLRRWDKAISKVLMGQTLTAEMDGSGSRAASETHYGVAGDIAEADQFMVVSAMNDIALMYRDVNASDVSAPVFGYVEPEDYASQAKLDKELHGMGVRFEKVHFERRYALNPEEFRLEGSEDKNDDNKDKSEEGKTVTGSDFSQPDNGREKSKNKTGQNELDALIRDVLPQGIAANEKFISQLENTIQAAESWEEMKLGLAELLTDNGIEEGQQLFEEVLALSFRGAGLMS
ncbi:MAG: DUF935 domain-containing protein [Desulfovibrio sp.]